MEEGQRLWSGPLPPLQPGRRVRPAWAPEHPTAGKVRALTRSSNRARGAPRGRGRGLAGRERRQTCLGERALRRPPRFPASSTLARRLPWEAGGGGGGTTVPEGPLLLRAPSLGRFRGPRCKPAAPSPPPAARHVSAGPLCTQSQPLRTSRVGWGFRPFRGGPGAGAADTRERPAPKSALPSPRLPRPARDEKGRVVHSGQHHLASRNFSGHCRSSEPPLQAGWVPCCSCPQGSPVACPSSRENGGPNVACGSPPQA